MMLNLLPEELKILSKKDMDLSLIAEITGIQTEELEKLKD